MGSFGLNTDNYFDREVPFSHVLRMMNQWRENRRGPGLLSICGLATAALVIFASGARAQWLGDLTVAETISRSQNRPLILYFRDPAAPACRKFETETLTQPGIADRLSHYVLLQLNPRWNESLASNLGIYRVPGLAIRDPKGQVLYRAQGNIVAEELAQQLSLHSSSEAPAPVSVPAETPMPRMIELLPPPSVAESQPLTVRARVTDASMELRLNYRAQGQRSYTSVLMTSATDEPNLLQATIPGRRVQSGGMEFYLSGKYQGKALALPPDYYDKPYRIEVR